MSPALPRALSLQELQKWVTSTTFQRGLNLHLQGRVRACDVAPTEGGWILSGRVQGSVHEPYEVGATLTLGPSGRIQDWAGDCSCPVGLDCKHAVALSMTAMQTGGITAAGTSTGDPAARSPDALAKMAQEVAVEQWLGQQRHLAARLPFATDRDAPRPSGPPQRLVVMLALKDRSGRSAQSTAASPRFLQLEATCGLSRPKVQGSGWTKPDTGITDALAWSRLAQLSASEQDVLSLARGLRAALGSYSYNVGGPVQGRFGVQLLQEAAALGALFFGETVGRPMEKTLRWGPVHPARPQWVCEDASNPSEPTGWRLQLVTEVPDLQLSLSEHAPLLYVDTAQGECGEIALPPGVTVSALRRWLSAPVMRDEQLLAHQAALTPLLEGLPAPPALSRIRRIQGVVPRWRLVMHRDPTVPWPQAGWLYVVLSFIYEDLELRWRGDVLARSNEAVVLAGQSCMVLRDAAHEMRAQLVLLGYQIQLDSLGMGEICTDATWWLDQLELGFAVLCEAGFEVSIDETLHDWVHTGSATEGAVDARWLAPDDAKAGGHTEWFDLSLGIEIAGQRHNLLPWMPQLLEQWSHTHQPEHFIVPLPETAEDATPGLLRIPAPVLQPWLDALVDLHADHPDAFSGESLQLKRIDALRTAAALGVEPTWEGAAILQQMLQGLRDTRYVADIHVPANVNATLRAYQQQGLNWLQFLREHQLAGILADDMGLGKTLQTLAHIQVEKNAGRLDRPTLVIAPVSLMSNWQREVRRFCPELSVQVFHGRERYEAAQTLSQYDVVIAPYSLLQRDRDLWLSIPWHLVVLDEAQNIKNASTQAAQVVAALNARHRLCLSGTPMENHLGELWSLFHFLMPGFLASSARFTKLYRHPIEKYGDLVRLAQLQARITPFILRRTKRQVATELPAKTETLMPVELSGAQADLYETIRLSTERTVREALQSKGLSRSRITILDALLKLRQVCCDPRLLKLDAAKKVKPSAKLEQLMSMLPEMIVEGRRILLFSQFTSMLSLIEAELAKHKLPWVKLTGQTRDRAAVIDAFNQGDVPLFLISLKAGGVGLNLSTADTVIHFDPWWNPAVEQQATDRAHRIGQAKNVWVIKLVAQGTVEERIVTLQERKAALANSVYGGAEARQQPLLTESDLNELLKPLGSG